MSKQDDPLAGLKRPYWKIIRVNGFAIRNYDPDWDVVECRESFTNEGTILELQKLNLLPTIPQVTLATSNEVEVWVDQRFWSERHQLLNIHWYEVELRKLGWARDAIREFLNRNLPKTLPPREEFVVKEEKHEELTICYVRGDIIRARLDCECVFGRHKLVSDYVPENEIWVDMCQDPLEVPYVIYHEIFEYRLMQGGMDYDTAHNLATKAEKCFRSLNRNPPFYWK